MAFHPDSGNLKVVRHDPSRVQRTRIFLGIFLLVAIAAAYWFGGSKAGHSNSQLVLENQELVQEASQLRDQNKELQQRVAILESGGKIDHEAINRVRLTVKKLENDKEQLSKELVFFKSILAPEDLSTGVRVAGLDLLKGEEAGKFRFRLVVSQVARSNPFLKGVLTVSLVGKQGGGEKFLSLQQLAGLEQMSTTLGFRYFQALPGDRDFLDFELPEGFEPEVIKVAVRIRSGAVQSFEKIYQWDKELAADVRQEQSEG